MSKSVPAEVMTAVTQLAYGGPEVLELSNLPLPKPAKGQVLIEVEQAAIDRGTWHLLYGLPKLVRLGIGIRRPRQVVPGLDVYGVVRELGEGVTEFGVGDRVFGIAAGSLAQYAVANSKKLAKATDALDPAQWAALGVSGLTALQALRAASLGPGDRLLVGGASGGVGSFVVQLAADAGLEVTALCSPEKADAVRAFGATHVIDRHQFDPASSDHKFDAIIDIAGGTSAKTWRRLLTEAGTIVFVGNDTGGQWTGGFFKPAFEALKSKFRRDRYVMLVSAEDGNDLAALAELATAGRLTVHLGAKFELAQVPDAIEYLESGQAVGKIAIAVRR